MSNSLATTWRRNPAVVSIIGLILLGFVLAFFGMREAMTKLLFTTLTVGQQPWSFLTFPFASGGEGNAFFWLLLSCMWLWQFGSQTETTEGWKRFVAIWLLASFVSALCLWMGGAALKTDAILAGSLLPSSTVTLIWCGRNQTQTIQLFGLIAIPGRILGLITALIVFFGAGTAHPLMGLFLMIPLAAGFYYGSQAQVPVFGANHMSKAERKKRAAVEQARVDAAMDKQKEREEKQRLRELFERSLIDDPDQKSGS